MEEREGSTIIDSMKITKDMLKTGLPKLKTYSDGRVNCVLAVNNDSIYTESNLYMPKWCVVNVAYYRKHPKEFDGYIELEDIRIRLKKNNMKDLFTFVENGVYYKRRPTKTKTRI